MVTSHANTTSPYADHNTITTALNCRQNVRARWRSNGVTGATFTATKETPIFKHKTEANPIETFAKAIEAAVNEARKARVSPWQIAECLERVGNGVRYSIAMSGGPDVALR
jgi:hypothetical protein